MLRGFHMALLASVLGLIGREGLASGTWTVDTHQEFLAGTWSNINALTSTGYVSVRRNFDDEFPGTSAAPLPSYWAVEINNGSYDRISKSEFLRLFSGALASEWWQGNDTAPKILQPVDGDFTIETYIDYSGVAPHNSCGAQLFVRKDSNNWFAIGIQQPSGGAEYEARVTTAGVSKSLVNLAGLNTGWFRIQKVGNAIKSFYSTNGVTWIQMPVADTIISWPVLAAGVYVYDSAAGGFVDFDYVRFSTVRSTPASGVYYSQTIDLGVAPASKGTISWVGTSPPGTIEVNTRTSVDGVVWSGWSGPYVSAGGSSITSSLNRFLQFSATLTEDGPLNSPTLDKVTIVFPGIAPLAPVVSSSTNPNQGWGNTEPVQLTWVEPAGNPVPVWAYYYALNAPVLSGGSLAGGAVILSATVTGMTLAGLADGLHEFRIVAQGQPAEYPLSGDVLYVIKKDILPPGPVVISSPTHSSTAVSDNNSPTFNLSAGDVTTATTYVSGVAGYHYVLDNNPSTSPDTGSSFTTGTTLQFSGLQVGAWWLHARAKDGAGNLGSVSHYAINIIVKADSLAPGPVSISSPTHPSTESTESNSPIFYIASTDNAFISATTLVSGLAGYHYVLDNSPGTIPGAGDTFTVETTLEFSGLRNGSWWLHVLAKDVAGNLGAASHYAIIVNFTGRILDAKRVHAVPHPIRTERATIRYELLAPAQEIQFEFLDSVGHSVGRISGITSAGTNTVVWETAGLANGVYFCKIRVRKQDGKEDIVIKRFAVVR